MRFQGFLTTACLTVFAAVPAIPLQAATIQLLQGSLTTPDAATQANALCPSGVGYPREGSWAGRLLSAPVSAVSGDPRIEQYRGGRYLATYHSLANRPGCKFANDGTDYLYPAAPAASGCGPFSREYTYRLWAPGDVFYVYPAVYSGEYNQPWFGPQADSSADYSAGIFHTPDSITVQGVVQNNTRPVILLQGDASNNTLGQAPVYFDVSTGMTIDSLNVTAGPGAAVGKAGIYEVAASNLTLSNMRINGFERSGANGLFGAGGYSGTLTLQAVELDHNGGPNGPAHNAYIGASMVDPAFTVIMSNSWSHDAYYGHLFKTRAQNAIFTANYFQGGLPQAHKSQAENYLLDIPNGGQVTVRNNIFVKNASGVNANAMSLTFLMEGFTDDRPQSLDAENNTFVTFAKAYDGVHVNYPFSFFYPNIRPDSASWPAGIPARVLKNAFVGYCTPNNGSAQDYRGDISVVESFLELTRVYAFKTKVAAGDAALSLIYGDYVPELGTPAFSFRYGATPVRRDVVIGAED